MDFMSDAADEAPTQTETPRFVSNVVVMPTPHDDSWHGLWAFDAAGGHQEVYGDKLKIIAWAKERSDRVLVWSEELRDLELLAGV